ncbi:cysteine desulfurase [Patescibacteria group bacterium]|nr:cysteine desulfurase [Patescibacteria group bacterium]
MTANSRIYLDHSATTPLDPKALRKMQPYFTEKFGNPASIHTYGQEALKAVDEAREAVAEFLDATNSEIFFTSGATEANNMVLRGTMEKRIEEGNHFITSKIEHPSILETARSLEKDGFMASYLPVDKEGRVSKESVQKAITKKTVLVSIMYANNEVGAIQPIKEIGKLIRKENKKRLKEGLPEIYFHVDAVQGINFLDCSVKRLRCHLLSLSGHKFYGPKGIGVLYKQEGVALKAQATGGHQERNVRAGTSNVPGIIGLAEALKIANKNREKSSAKVFELKKYLIQKIKDQIPNIKVNSPESDNKGLPNIANISFPGAEGESILLKLDFAGIAVSTGSACSSTSLEPSHVLLAQRLTFKEAHSSVRFSLGKHNTKKEINYLMKHLPKIIEDLRKMSPIK